MAKNKKAERQVRLDARAEQLRAQSEAEARTRNMIIAVFAVLILGGAGVLYVLANPPAFLAGPTTPAPPDHSVAVANEGNTHVAYGTPTVYKHYPPTSGDHYNQPPQAPRPWNAYKTALLPGEWVHNLEHGGIVLVYKCTGAECDTDYNKVFDIAKGIPKEAKYQEQKFLSTPYNEDKWTSGKIAVLAWDRELDLTTFDAAAITAFYTKYVDHGREDVG
ncbi:MAG: DUF3105 domain-containing protein [Candidatus Dormibacteria bacterium]